MALYHSLAVLFSLGWYKHHSRFFVDIVIKTFTPGEHEKNYRARTLRTFTHFVESHTNEQNLLASTSSSNQNNIGTSNLFNEYFKYIYKYN